MQANGRGRSSDRPDMLQRANFVPRHVGSGGEAFALGTWLHLLDGEEEILVRGGEINHSRLSRARACSRLHRDVQGLELLLRQVVRQRLVVCNRARCVRQLRGIANSQAGIISNCDGIGIAGCGGVSSLHRVIIKQRRRGSAPGAAYTGNDLKEHTRVNECTGHEQGVCSPGFPPNRCG